MIRRPNIVQSNQIYYFESKNTNFNYHLVVGVARLNVREVVVREPCVDVVIAWVGVLGLSGRGACGVEI